MDIKFIPKKKSYEPVLKINPPVISNKILPDWYKDLTRTVVLDSGFEGGTAKKCPAIQDILTTGFVIPLWTKLQFASIKDTEGNIVKQNWTLGISQATKEPIEHHLDYHYPYQTKGMELNKTIDNTVLKLSLPYKIVVPNGYNIKYSDPFYHFRKDIRCLPGIVEADKWGHVTFPFEILSNNFVMEAGTPLIHCLVFKREEPINLIMKNGTTKDYDKIHEDYFELFSTEKNYRTK